MNHKLTQAARQAALQLDSCVDTESHPCFDRERAAQIITAAFAPHFAELEKERTARLAAEAELEKFRAWGEEVTDQLCGDKKLDRAALIKSWPACAKDELRRDAAMSKEKPE